MSSAIQKFLKLHSLPESYASHAETWFKPIAETLIQARSEHPSQGAIIIGLNGTQGSGKSTLAAYLCNIFSENGYRALGISLDDFYLSQKDRIELSEKVHPLFKTRGVPGTHDVACIKKVLQALRSGDVGITIPSFDKANDDPFPTSQFHTVDEPYDFVVMEGWCWGAQAQTEADLDIPVNELERSEDSDAHWRKYVNQSIIDDYLGLYSLVDAWLMLKAPSFDCVFNWRMEQERKLADKVRQQGQGLSDSKVMDEEKIKRFIQHFERITRHQLETFPQSCDVVWHLNEKREVEKVDNQLNHKNWSLL